MYRITKRFMSLLLVACLLIPYMPATAFAADGCVNHTEHDSLCGYQEEAAQILCTHGHTDECWQITCTHVHDGNCPLGEDGACSFQCTQAEDCAVKSQICSHVEGGDCCYAAAVESQPCSHSSGGCESHSGCYRFHSLE